MTSRQLHNIIKTLTPAQISSLNEKISLLQASASLMDKPINQPLLTFIKSDMAGESPKMLEKYTRKPRSSKVRIIREAVYGN